MLWDTIRNLTGEYVFEDSSTASADSYLSIDPMVWDQFYMHLIFLPKSPRWVSSLPCQLHLHQGINPGSLSCISWATPASTKLCFFLGALKFPERVEPPCFLTCHVRTSSCTWKFTVRNRIFCSTGPGEPELPFNKIPRGLLCKPQFGMHGRRGLDLTLDFVVSLCFPPLIPPSCSASRCCWPQASFLNVSVCLSCSFLDCIFPKSTSYIFQSAILLGFQ